MMTLKMIFRNKIKINYFLKPKPYNINNNESEIKQRVKRAFLGEKIIWKTGREFCQKDIVVLQKLIHQIYQGYIAIIIVFHELKHYPILFYSNIRLSLKIGLKKINLMENGKWILKIKQ